MTFWRTETDAVSRMEKAVVDCCCSHQSVASPSLLVSGLMVDILWCFHSSVTQCVKLTLRIFEFWVLLFYCFVYRLNVTRLSLNRFTMHEHYAGEVEVIIIGWLACSCLKSLCENLGAFILRFDDAVLKVVGWTHCSLRETVVIN